MQTATFSELRRKAKKYLDAVEQGEIVRITRRGRVIARIVPEENAARPSWKRSAVRISVPGAELSKLISEERDDSA